MSEERADYKTRFQKGNKAHAKSPKVVLRKFLQMLENAKNDETILSYQDATASIGWRDSKCNYWSSKLPEFANLKTDIQNAIVRRINKNALKGEFAGAASIWRMKQLGEVDQSTINQNHSIGEGSVNIDKWIENNAD